MSVFMLQGRAVILNDDEDVEATPFNPFSYSRFFPIADGASFEITDTQEIWTSYI